MKTFGSLAISNWVGNPVTEIEPSSGLDRFVSDPTLLSDLRKERVFSLLTATQSDSSLDRTPTQLLQDTLNLGEPATPLILKPVRKVERQDYSLSLQKWEGVVLEIKGDVLTARLVDLTEKGRDEEAEFSIDEVSQGDRDLLQPGAVFYWNIGYVDSRSGQRTRASLIRFRRLPVWTREEIEGAELEADRLSESIGWK